MALLLTSRLLIHSDTLHTIQHRKNRAVVREIKMVGQVVTLVHAVGVGGRGDVDRDQVLLHQLIVEVGSNPESFSSKQPSLIDSRKYTSLLRQPMLHVLGTMMEVPRRVITQPLLFKLGLSVVSVP